MENFSLNPLKWFKRTPQDGKFSANCPEPMLKPRATPRKNGNVFMHLITLQKSLQSLDLALRQEIDCRWLIQKIAGQISVLKLEAEAGEAEELAGASGQVLAYFETISEGRLELNAGGVTMMREFVHIFKDAIGDAGPGVKSLDREQLKSWNARYQRLMAKMRPMSEDMSAVEIDEFADQDAVEQAEEVLTIEEMDVWSESYEKAVEEPVPSQDSMDSPIPDELVKDEEPAASSFLEDSGVAQEPELVTADVGDASPDAHGLSVYDPKNDTRVRDAVISDEEMKAARGIPETERVAQEISFEEKQQEDSSMELPDRPRPFEAGRKPGQPREASVQIEEVERLKKRLLDLHERQEMLSSKMSGILGGYEKAVKEHAGDEAQDATGDEAQDATGDEALGAVGDEAQRAAGDELDIEELENLIFIGRKKG